MSTNTSPADIAVLGGGPGGYVAAIAAAQRGARVTLIEQARVGGTCLNVGCIPTKALATSADLLTTARSAQDFGLRIPSATADLSGLMRYKQGVVDQLVGGVEQLLRARRVCVVRGHGRFVNPQTIAVSSMDGVQEVTAPRIIVATGSRPVEPSIEGRDLPGVMGSTAALEIDEVPNQLVIIGGGVIGLEFACIYEALGSQVTIIEMAATILPQGVDETIAKRFQVLLRRRGMRVITGVSVERIERVDNGLQVIASGTEGQTAYPADRVLLATGRRPNSEGAEFATAGINMQGQAVAVDDQMKTNLPGVWAIGDLVGGWMLAHKAMVEGRVAAENATGGQHTIDYRSVPNVIFTRPEIAGVGLTEAQARQQGREVVVSQFAFAANPKARILGETEGLVRFLCEPGGGRLLGVHLLGPHATDLIAEGALAVQMGATADDLAWTTHAHPTLPEAFLEAALGFRGGAIHVHSR